MPRAPETSFNEFRQRVRRHSPSTLLPALAVRAGQLLERHTWFEGPRVENPWALAAAARASLMYGSEWRSAATGADVLAVCSAFASMRAFRPGAVEDQRTFWLRTAYEQLTYQSSAGNDVARSVAMFRDSLAAVSPQVLTPDRLEEVLGGSVVDFVGVGWLLFASALGNNGWFHDEWIDGPQFADVREGLPADALRRLIEGSFSADPAALRADGAAHLHDHARDDAAGPNSERFAYNPLASRPLVIMQPSRYLIPSPLLLLRKLTTTGIYYTAMGATFEASIGRDLGTTFEHYVGRQLRQLPGAQVVPEVSYGKSRALTVDWFVVLDDLVVLVEVKAPRLTVGARAGGSALAAELDRTIGKSRQQIDRTADLLQAEQPELVAAGVPTDRPVRGVIVTLEPYHLVQSPLIEPLLPAVRTPTTVASIADLEHLIAVALNGPDLATLLGRIQDDPELATWSPVQAVHREWPAVTGTNPILDAAAAELPWT